MRSGVYVLTLLAPAVLGCASTVSTGPGDAEAMTTTSAIVVIERTTDATGSRAEASARFVRTTAKSSAEDALRVIGASLDLPAPGSCATIASLAGSGTAGEIAPVLELVDVGSVSLEARGVETRLVPRQLPDVTDVVSGIVYARAADAALLPADTSYLVHVSGGPNVDPLDVSASAPGDPSDVHVAGEDTKGILVAAGAWVDLTWAADRADDVVYTDVQPASLRCVLGVGTADGKGLVHASLSASLFDDAGTLVVHRVRRESFRARNLESGVVRFDFSRSIAYARR